MRSIMLFLGASLATVFLVWALVQAKPRPAPPVKKLPTSAEYLVWRQECLDDTRAHYGVYISRRSRIINKECDEAAAAQFGLPSPEEEEI